ncbi:hypothetical protein FisN_27Lh090 [Fistulifera solaris]|uniref:Uncharacterized protein n=1 Tax=Fistulifera solaris TaxID=1519565 RepID=A0A1Z5KAT8_FISSO|nr:hypothetical protein FisN_27Lh090 [Fistulifera solaris]|eukprot:GAX23316.1 hypothetical protein FisN_27Lh090 [Fistulifera solaris]
MRSRLVTLKVQAIAGILVDTFHADENNVRVFVRVIHVSGNICAASSLSNPLKVSPTEKGSTVFQRQVAVWPCYDDPCVFEANDGERFQFQVCLNIPGRGNFPIGSGNWEVSTRGDCDVSIGCFLAPDKRRSIAYCIDSSGGAMLRIMANWEKDEIVQDNIPSEIYTKPRIAPKPFALNALKLQYDSHYVSVDDEGALATDFIIDPKELRGDIKFKPKSPFRQFFRRSNASDNKARVGDSVERFTMTGNGMQIEAASARVPFWSSPKPVKRTDPPRRPSPTKASAPYSFQPAPNDVSFQSVMRDEVGESPLGSKGVRNANNESPMHEIKVVKELFPPESNAFELKGRPFHEASDLQPILLHPGKGSVIPRQFSEDSESFADVYERPLIKRQLRPSPKSPQVTRMTPTQEWFGLSEKESYRRQSPTAVWDSISSRTPSPVETITLQATELSIVNPLQSVPRSSKQSKYTELQHRAIPVHSPSEMKHNMHRFRQEVNNSLKVLDTKSSAPPMQIYDYGKAAFGGSWPADHIKQSRSNQTYSSDTQQWRLEEMKHETGLDSRMCLSTTPSTPANEMPTLETRNKNTRSHHNCRDDEVSFTFSKGHESMSTTDNETRSASDVSGADKHTASEPPPDFLLCQGDGSYFCKLDEDAVLRRRRLWREKMCAVAQNSPHDIYEKPNLNFPSYDEAKHFASEPFNNSRMRHNDIYCQSTFQHLRSIKEDAPMQLCSVETVEHLRSSSARDDEKQMGLPPLSTLEGWSPNSLLGANAKTLGQSIVALVEPFVSCATVRPPDHPVAVPSKIPSTINGEEASVGELTATTYERHIDRLRRQSTMNLQETLRSGQQNALKFFGFHEDVPDNRDSLGRTCSVSTKKEDYFSEYKGLK